MSSNGVDGVIDSSCRGRSLVAGWRRHTSFTIHRRTAGCSRCGSNERATSCGAGTVPGTIDARHAAVGDGGFERRPQGVLPHHGEDADGEVRRGHVDGLGGVRMARGR